MKKQKPIKERVYIEHGLAEAEQGDLVLPTISNQGVEIFTPEVEKLLGKRKVTKK